MAELILRPILAQAAEARPPLRRSLLLLPATLAIIGMLIAWAAATTGQDARRERDQIFINYEIAYWTRELAQARLAGKPPEEIESIEKTVAQKRGAGIASYARYGRQFTPWDGYRYEEIVDQGYFYHRPNDTEDDKRASAIRRAGWPEPRTKNVVWYPLYPSLAWLTMKALDIPSTHALTVVSWTCCLLASIVLFLFARRHYFNRMPALDLTSEEVRAAEAHPARRWDLSPEDSAALWVVAMFLFGPCAIFLYANFTESLFTLLLASFLYCIQSRWWWRAALVAGIASACRSQGVLFGPILALSYLLRANRPNPAARIGIAAVLGMISAIGIGCYMTYLYMQFHDPLAFMTAQKYWSVGLSWDRIVYAANPTHAMTRLLRIAFFNGEVDWPRLWEALCLIWPPILLLILGGRYLSFELELLGWILWGLPYISQCMAGYPPMDTQWMSMGRFMAVLVPAYIIAGAVFVRVRWLGLAFMIIWSSMFAIFAYKYGSGAWVG